MSLIRHTLSLTPVQARAARRVNAAMALAPRLKADGWRLACLAQATGDELAVKL